MKKNVKTSLVLAATLVAAGAVAQEVKADEVQSQLVPEQGQEAVKPATTVEEQKQVVDKAKTAADTASQTVETAKKAVDTAQDTVNNANPETISAAKEEVTAAKESVTDAQDKETTAQTQLEAAQAAQTEQAQDVTTAQNAVDTAQAAATTAQTAVTEAEQAVAADESGAAIAAAQEKVTTAENKVAEREAELTAAQEKDAQRQANIDKAQENLSAANQELTAAQNKVSEAEGQVRNTFTVSPDYASNLQAYTTVDFTERPAVTERLLSIAKANYDANNFVSSKVDKARQVELNNIPADTLKELNLYAKDLINQIRTAVGGKPVTVTQNMIDLASDFAQEVADYNKEKHYSSDRDSETKAKYGMDQHGVNVTTSNYYDYDVEEKKPVLPSQPTMSVDALKEWTYNTIKKIFFVPEEGYNGKTFTYASAYSGLQSSERKSDIPTYLGLDFASTDFHNTIHLVTTDAKDYNVYPYDASKFANVLEDPTVNSGAGAEEAQAALAAAKSKVADANLALQRAKDVFEEAPNAAYSLQHAKEDLETAQGELAAAQAAQADNPELAKKVAALKNAQADLTKQKEALAAAQEKLANAQASQADLAAKTAAAQEAVDKSKAEVLSAQEKLAAAQQRVDNLENADAILAQAKSDLKAAQEDLAAKTATYQKELDRLNALLALQGNDPEASGQATQPASEAKQTTVATTKQLVKKPVAYQAVQSRYGAAAQAQSLPATGDQSTDVFAISGLTLLGLLGLAGYKRREQDER